MKNVTGTFLVNWKFILQFQWAAPLNLPVTWQWSLNFYSSLSISFLQIQQLLLCRNKCSSSRLMIKCLLKCLFITFLQYLYSLRIALKELRNCISRIIPVWLLFCSTWVYTSLHFLPILLGNSCFVFLHFLHCVEFDVTFINSITFARSLLI